MSDPIRVVLLGATGLIGGHIIAETMGRGAVRLFAIARAHMPIPRGVRMEMIIADPANWPSVLADLRPDVVISALGTTWAKTRNEAAFRAVDQGLVLSCARAAKHSGAAHFIAISSVGADDGSRNFYLRVKGEVEADLRKIGFERLDILRPGLLCGVRGGERRIKERIAILLSPLINLMLHGKARKYRAISARVVAQAVLGLVLEKRRGRFSYHYDQILAESHSWQRARGR